VPGQCFDRDCERVERDADGLPLQVDRYVAWRLKRLLIKRKGRKLRAGEADRWTPAWLWGLGL
jgi:hypothetical protein